MKLWLASTDSLFVAGHFQLGVFEGVLTNPTLLAAAKRPAREVIAALCQACPGPVFYQLKDGGVEEMKKEAEVWLHHGWSNLGLKVALTRQGCALLHWLKTQRVQHRLATCVPTVTQVLLATALEVPWITPSGSALERLGGPGKLSLLAEMQAVLGRQLSATLLIPSLNSPAEMQALAMAGVTRGFVWQRDVDRFLDSELVRDGVAGFDPAWTELDRLSAAAASF